MMALPFVFTFLFLFFPSGLVLYWVVNNLLSRRPAVGHHSQDRGHAPLVFERERGARHRAHRRAPRAAGQASACSASPARAWPTCAPTARYGFLYRHRATRGVRAFRAPDGAVTAPRPGALRAASPASYTGEDVLGSIAHGRPGRGSDLLLERVIEGWARVARPGEFTERAFLRVDRIDLAQAEAVADLIDSSTEAAARSAAHTPSRAARRASCTPWSTT